MYLNALYSQVTFISIERYIIKIVTEISYGNTIETVQIQLEKTIVLVLLKSIKKLTNQL